MLETANRRAVKVIKEYDIDIDERIKDALRIILVHFRRNREIDENGTKIESCKLTALSIAIGKIILIKSNQRNISLYQGTCIDIGDFFLEGFYEFNWIDILRNGESLRDIKYCGGRKPWVVKRGRNWDEIYNLLSTKEKFLNIDNTSTTRIPDIDSLFQDNGKPVIKHWSLDKEKEFQNYINEPFVRAINKLQQTPWQIDQEILEIVKANPFKFYKTTYIEDEKLRESNKSKKDSYYWSIKQAENMEKKFYYYVDADYRGRLYYQEPFLNYQGQDLERGLLKFHNKQELTEDSLYYLKIHTASSYNQSYKKDELPNWLTTDYKPYLESEELETISVDKMTLQDRALWCNYNEDLILNTWINKTIHNCEKPVVFLACCKEWYNIENGMEYTTLPVAIDGSNNGWQHLAAISKDPKAGKLVGLVPIDIQKDFYVQTAKKLYSFMKDERLKDLLFRMPMKEIRKGISKRGSMTRAYSAGKVAIGKNMYADCHQEGFTIKYGITLDDCMILAGTLIEAINHVCPGPLSTMSFLQQMASHIIKTKDYIEWISPSGFPVLYEKYVDKDMKWKSWISKRRIEHVYKQPKYRKDENGNYTRLIPSPGKYASGISPNYIHSMDAAHMAIVIDNWSSDFGAIHDSFSCHANNVEDLLGLTKDVFVKMYDHKDFFEIIKEVFNCTEFEADYTIGQLNIQDIYNSDYFFA